MSNFSENLKKYRRLAGLTQDQAAEKVGVSVTAIQNWEGGINKPRADKISKLAYIYNVSEKVLAENLIAEATIETADNWPYFLFSDEINKIIKSLRLNLAQQELFGILYIYGADILKNTWTESAPIDIDLKKIPYEFIAKVGSINVINVAEGLKHVLDYVKTDFLLRELRKRPDDEFDICKLNKDIICDFIDHGLKQWDDTDDYMACSTEIHFHINMKEAENTLKTFEEYGDTIYWTDYDERNPHRDDIPEELKKYQTLHSFPLMYDHYTVHEEKAENGHNKIYISLTDKGKKLRQWFKE